MEVLSLERHDAPSPTVTTSTQLGKPSLLMHHVGDAVVDLQLPMNPPAGVHASPTPTDAPEYIAVQAAVVRVSLGVRCSATALRMSSTQVDAAFASNTAPAARAAACPSSVLFFQSSKQVADRPEYPAMRQEVSRSPQIASAIRSARLSSVSGVATESAATWLHAAEVDKATMTNIR